MIDKEDEPAPTLDDAEHDIEEAIERSYGKKLAKPLSRETIPNRDSSKFTAR